MARLRRKTSKAIFQHGGAYTGNVYRGRLPKRFSGGGFGSMISGALKKVGASALKSIPKQLAKTGVAVFHDITHGKNIKRSIANRGKQLAKNMVGSAISGFTNAAKAKPRKKRTSKKATAGSVKKARKKPKKQRGGGSLSIRRPNRYVAKNKKQNVFGDLM